jgi:predicted DCC family thiol-disulfide oxidoreductase YuxK
MTVFFDGSCPLCTAEIDLYRQDDNDRVLDLVDVSAPNALLPAGLDRSVARARFHVQSRDGILLSGAAAFAEIWRNLPRWRHLGRIATLPGVPSILEACYRAFLPIRPLAAGAFVSARRYATAK